MRNRIFLTTTFLLLIITVIAGCKKGSKDSEAPSMSRAEYSEEDVSLEGGSGSDDSSTGKIEIPDNRMRIKQGKVSYRVKELKQAEKVLEKQVKEYAGYIDSSTFWGNRVTMIVKIPAADFDNFVSASESVGTLLSKSITVEDVTDRFLDLENRIKNRRILLERYQEYLRKAKDVTELLKLEREINNLTTEIEGLEGSFKSLKHRISYSRLEIQLSTVKETVVTRNWPSLKRGFGDLGFALTNFFYGLLFVVIYFVSFGTPIVLLLALFYWLSFGRIGLIRRLFKLLSAKKE